MERPEPLEMKRVDSIFKERIERHKEELAELEEETKVIRRPLPVSLVLQQDQEQKISPSPFVLCELVGNLTYWGCD